MKKLTILLLLASFSHAFSQKVTFDPVDWQPDESVKITVDFNGTPFAGNPQDLYLWSWVKNGANESINSPNNGATFAASNINSKLNGNGNIREITVTPSAYFGFSKEHLSVSGINFLFKNLTGTQQSQNYEDLKPFVENGIKSITNWNPNKKIKLWVDVTGTPLAGTSDNLYYWGWFNNGGGPVNSVKNGIWTDSNEDCKLTRVGISNSYFIEIEPSEFFPVNFNSLSNTTLFGLIKKDNGNNGKTDDFGAGNLFKKYIVQQVNASNVSLTPNLPTDNVPVTFTFTAKSELLNATGDIFMHSGVVTDGLSSTSWNYTQGTWGNASSVGKMTRSTTNPNEYSLTIPSIRSYYGIPSGENAYKIMAVFRNADGSILEKDGTNDFQLEISPSRYLEIREPAGTFNTGLVNQPFRITGFTNQASDFDIMVNDVSVKTEANVKRSTFQFTPTTAGTYNIVVNANDGSGVLSRSAKVVVCAANSLANAAAVPAGLNYGINYNATDVTKATLVLHAPTESIKSVHVIGDFNNWTVDCNFLMNWDNAKKVFWKEITGLTSGQEYVFQYLIDGETRIGDPYTEKVSDPWEDASIPAATYPNLIQYPAVARPQNGETPTIASVLQTNQTEYVWKTSNFERIDQAKLNIYQLHFRDFTVEGTYKAAIEKLDYIKRMGINAIETLPVSEFEGNDSWGYNPNFYFAVDKAYGTKEDYKLFVDECHKRGIAVIGDIVLNHAFGTNPHARMYWDNLRNRPANNNPWFNAVSNFANPGAQWGQDFNHESIHTKAFVDSVINYWLTEFKIDGIRFDFTKGIGNTPYTTGGQNNGSGCFDEWGGCYDAPRIALLKRMADYMWGIQNGATGSHPYVIFEHLATQQEDTELGNYSNGILLWSGVSPNYKYGEIASGWPPTAQDPNKSNLNDVYYRNKGFTKPVWVSYMESHDEDRLGYFQKQFGNGNIKTDSVAAAKFLETAAAMNLLFTGPRQIWQFGELGYDVHINFNGRTGRKPVRWDYFDYPQRRKIYETYSRLFWLRNALPNTFHRDFDNTGGAKTDLVSQFKRYHFYSSVGDTAVTIIANTGNSIISGNPDFNDPGATQWFEFITQQWHSPSSSMTLQPGEYRIYMNKEPKQASPEFALTSIQNGIIGNENTNIEVTFNQPMLKFLKNTFLGNQLNATNINSSFELLDASSNPIAFTGSVSFDNKTILIDPNQLLSAGNYTLKLNKDSLQNFGGIQIKQDVSFNFTVQIDYPCVSTKNFDSVSDNFSTGIINQQTRENLSATNVISGNAKVTYDAKTNVLLLPGFSATASGGAVFAAKIGGCE